MHYTVQVYLYLEYVYFSISFTSVLETNIQIMLTIIEDELSGNYSGFQDL